MGLYVQGNSIRRNGFRRQSVDDLDDVKDDGSSIDLGRDSVINPNDIAAILKHKRKDTEIYRVRKRTNKLLHTHIALILVCILSSLDAGCVIGQIICDILIMSDSLYENEQLHTKATEILFQLLPTYLNKSEHKDWDFEAVIEHLETVVSHGNDSNPHGNEGHENAENHVSPEDPHGNEGHATEGGSNSSNPHGNGGQNAENHLRSSNTHSGPISGTNLQEIFNKRSIHHRSKRSASSSNDDSNSHHESHTVLEELTHIFHIGSMAILSALVLEIFFKIFAMWKHFLNHKLEVFDAFVVIVSWCLDVAFWEGIWARPGQEGATILIFILPWRVVRIVNSFVLVIQEKDLVLLKVVKQRLRAALRREKDSSAKLDRYRLEVRQLQGLCRKHGAEEGAIQACNPAGKRRRSSLFSSLSSLASVAFVSAIGKQPEPDLASSASSTSEDEDEIRSSSKVSRLDSVTSICSNSVAFTLSPGSEDTPNTSGVDNKVFRYDNETISNFQNTPFNEALKTRL